MESLIYIGLHVFASVSHGKVLVALYGQESEESGTNQGFIKFKTRCYLTKVWQCKKIFW